MAFSVRIPVPSDALTIGVMDFKYFRADIVEDAESQHEIANFIAFLFSLTPLF